MERIVEFCKQQNMLENGDGVVIGFSGGADSVCMLLAFLELRKRYGLKLLAVHVHHGIRGEAADRDAQFARTFCEEANVEFCEERVDVPTMAKQLSMTEEEAGRKARYDCFQRLLRERGYQKIAVAHHKNDLAETMVFHMARGTGLEGLKGIRPMSGVVIRPLLCLTRAEIEEILQKQQVSYCTDETNQDEAYTRNYIRSQVIPSLEVVNDRTLDHLAALSDKVYAAGEYISSVVEEAYQNAVTAASDGMLGVDVGQIQTLHAYIRSELIRRVIGECTGSLKDVQSIHIDSVLELRNKQSGKEVHLPYGIVVRKEYDKLLFLKETECETKLQPELVISGAGKYHLANGDSLKVDILEKSKKSIGKKRYTKYFDCGTINSTLVVRNPQPKDYIVIDTDGNRKKLNRYFMDLKVPAHLRSSQLVLADGDSVLWVIGHRIDEAHKVSEQTETIWKITYRKEGETKDGES